MELQDLIKAGQDLGFEGSSLQAFVKEQQQHAREERHQQREFEREEKEREEREREKEREERERQSQREFELRRIQITAEVDQTTRGDCGTENKGLSKMPKLPPFDDSKDAIDKYLLRFERIAKVNKWPEEIWASSLSTLLGGKALDAYSRLSEQESKSYSILKESLLKCYKLTDEGFRKKFRNSMPEKDESPRQFATRLRDYLEKWVELSCVDYSVEGILNLFVVEQFLESCSEDLATYLRTHPSVDIGALTKEAENYLAARGMRSFGGGFKLKGKNIQGNYAMKSVQNRRFQKETQREEEEPSRSQQEPVARRSHNMQSGDDSAGNQIRKCFLCGRANHIARFCRFGNQEKGQHQEGSRSIAPKSAVVFAVNDGRAETASGSRCSLECSSSANPSPLKEHVEADGSSEASGCGAGKMLLNDRRMPVAWGKVHGRACQVLRDTGCNCIIVRNQLVRDEDYTGTTRLLVRVDRTFLETPVARINIDTPFLQGQVEAHVVESALYDLIIGNVEGAKGPEYSKCEDALQPQEGEGSHEPKSKATERMMDESDEVTSRGSADSVIGAGEENLWVIDDFKVTKKELSRMQREDQSLKDLFQKKDVVQRGQGTSRYEVNDGLLYRIYVHPQKTHGTELSQVVLPKRLRGIALRVAHDSVLGAHAGIGRTLERVLSCFVWPGINSDVRRYCQSCDICQRTSKRGLLKKAPLGRMPIVDVAWKRIAVDLVGIINPPSERGHQYILTVVDYATRYPEAVPLFGCTSEDVADALFELYCRMGVPQEILSDLGRQFISECMNQVSELMGNKHLKTSVAHPMTNGLVERYNETLKSTLRKMCSLEPKQWDKYLPALLFSYREIPQESTGFAPFELLYGRTVRGPMQILQELWAKDQTDDEVKLTYQYVFDLRNRLEEMSQMAHKNLEAAQERQKRFFDRHTKMRTLHVGDEVLVMMPTEKNKLLMQWKGPFRVIAKIGRTDYKLEVGNLEKIFHINLLKKYIRRNGLEELSKEETRAQGLATVTEGRENEEGDDELEPESCFPSCGEKTGPHDCVLENTLTAKEQSELKEVINRHSSIFTTTPGTCLLAEHRVPVPGGEIVQSRPYPVPYSMRDELSKEIHQMLEMNVIRPSSSPYASPLVVVKKRDGSNRVCVDYRKLNKVTVFDPEPMPLLRDMLQKLEKAQYFSRLDLSKAYWQIPVAEADIPKTAFVTFEGKFEFLKMPFGMKSAGATLTRCMNELLRGAKNVCNFMDDILVYTETWQEHLKVMEEILKRLDEAGLTANPKKCEFGRRSVEFLGHKLSNGNIQPSEANLEKINNIARPRTKKEVRAFVALVGFYRDFVPNFADKAAPLTSLTRKGVPSKITWTSEAEEAYQVLKDSVLRKPVLSLPCKGEKFILRCDASNVGLGAALLQSDGKAMKPICFASRKLAPREARYSTIEKECLAIVWAINKFEVYLWGRDFTLQTDHQSLTYLDKAKFSNARVMRWAMALQSFCFRIEQVKGVDNLDADYLSRVGHE